MFFSIVATHEAQVMPLTVKKHFSYSCSTSLLNRTAAGLSSTVLADFPNPLPVDKSNLVPSTQQRKLLVRQVCNCACPRISWSKQRWIYSFLAKVYKAIKKGKQKRSNHPNLKNKDFRYLTPTLFTLHMPSSNSGHDFIVLIPVAVVQLKPIWKLSDTPLIRIPLFIAV